MRKLHFPRATGISLTVVAVMGSLMVVPATIASAEAPASSDLECFPMDEEDLKAGVPLLNGMDRIWVEVNGWGGDPDSLDPRSQMTGLGASIQGWYPVAAGEIVSGDNVEARVSVDNVPVAVAGSGGGPGQYYSDATGYVLGNAGGNAGLPGEYASDGSGIQPGSTLGAGLGGGPAAGGAGGVNPPAVPGEPGVEFTGGWGGYGHPLGGGGHGGRGFYGGGGGAASTEAVPGAGGGGGSSYVAPGFEVVQAELVAASWDGSFLAMSVKQCGPRAAVDAERVAAIEAVGYQCLAPVAFEYAGVTETFTVPTDATVALIDTYGASGGAFSISATGLGGMTSAVVAVEPGETLQVNVGGRGDYYTSGDVAGELPGPIPGGFNGGGGVLQPNYSDGNWVSTGGGGSDVRKYPYDANSRIVVGGGGGGGAGNSFHGPRDILPGGAGGETGGNGTLSGSNPAVGNVIGTGATTTGPGTNGIIRFYDNKTGQEVDRTVSGTEPSAISGGDFHFTRLVNEYDRFKTAFGGGGGWYGGGAGGAFTSYIDGVFSTGWGTAGGGSSYAIAGPSGLPVAHMESGVRVGDGLVYITTCAKVGGGGTTPVENAPKGPQNIAATGSTSPEAVIWAAAAASLLGTALVLSARRRRSL